VSKSLTAVSSTAWYDSPLYYDIVYQDYTRPETKFLEAIARKHGPVRIGPLRILEPACGSGRLMESLGRRGHVVHGFDINPHMLRYAKARLAKAKIKGVTKRGRLESFRCPAGAPYDLAHCLVSTFKYILTESGARRHLQLIAQSLRPGGLYVIGLHLTDYQQSEPDHEQWIRQRGAIRVQSDTWSEIPNRQKRTEACRTRMRVREGRKQWKEETHWDFRTYSPAELRKLLKSVPEFKLIACHDFHYEMQRKRNIDNRYGDIVLVLRRNTKSV
jgi:SAM-dependent methyltransferase